MADNSMHVTSFELIKNNTDISLKEKNNNSTNDAYIQLQMDNDSLDELAEELIYDIDNIIKDESITKSVAFKSIISSLKMAVKEYSFQKTIFEMFKNEANELANEDSKVRLLDSIREILKNRRVILDDITDNLIKLQKLDNDRRKIDLSINENDDIDNAMSPDSF